MSIIQQGPRKRSWRFWLLDEYYSDIPFLPATYFAFASGLANIFASNL